MNPSAWKALVLTAGFLAITLSLSGQKKMVSGTVKDQETGEALPGVSVMVKGTGNGTITDIDGKYAVSVNPSDVLLFSFIGFATQEIPVGEKKSIDIGLEVDVQSLEEVVVVDYGYGNVKKSDNTGSVASLSGADLKKIPMSSTAQALTGRLPGVSVVTTDGSPDADVVIRVRGGGSITQDNAPLYVVDGFIVSSIRDIPPSDIESINVLKDAAATAIYGAQASNGVIVIRTRTPKAGKTSVSYNGFMQFKYLPKDRRYHVLSPYEYVMANYEYAKLTSETDLEKFERYFGTYEDLELYKYKKGTDWQDQLFGDAQISKYHNVSLTGGTENTRLSLSLTSNDDEGLLKGSGYARRVINFKLDQKVFEKLSFQAGARITNSVVNGAGTSGNAQLTIKDAVQTRPVNGIVDDLESGTGVVDSDDDYQSFLLSLVTPTELLKQDWRKRTANDYVMNAALIWQVIQGLEAKTTFTGSKEFEENLRFYGPLTNESYNNGGNLPIGEKTNTDEFSYRWLNTVSYKVPDFGIHSINILVGQEIYSTGGKRDFVRSEDFREDISPKELFANMTLGRTDRHETEDYTNSNRFSVFGRFDYQMMGKYLFTATMRADASSKFAEGNRLGFFPAVAIGWKISEEPFMKGIAVIDNLKFRASIGATGNDRVPSTATKFLFEASTNKGPGFDNTDGVYYTPSETTLYNPNLVWETTINRNVGFDFSFFKARLSGSLDAYYNSTHDLLLQSAIPSNTGFTSQWGNIGNTSNRGVELGLTGYLIETSDLSISATVNFGMNRARVDKLDGTTERFFQSNWASTDLKDQNDFYVKVGGTLGDIYGYVTDGYYSVDDFASYDASSGSYVLKEGVPDASATVGNTDIRPGFLKLKDLNGDGVITSEDRKVIGNTLPKAQGGFGFNGTYKGLDASIFFNWSIGNDVYNTGKIQYDQFRRVTYGNMLNTMRMSNRFTYIDVDGTYTGTPGDVVTDLEDLRTMNAGKQMWSHKSFGIANAVIHSWAVEDGSYLRLNQVTVGYTLPSEITRKVGLSQFRLYATGNNLHLWTRYSGFDPEVSTTTSSSYSGLTPGVDYSSYPRSRSYTIGINATF